MSSYQHSNYTDQQENYNMNSNTLSAQARQLLDQSATQGQQVNVRQLLHCTDIDQMPK